MIRKIKITSAISNENRITIKTFGNPTARLKRSQLRRRTRFQTAKAKLTNAFTLKKIGKSAHQLRKKKRGKTTAFLKKNRS